jgi:hypothetical protein
VGERQCWGSTARMAATDGVQAEVGVAWRMKKKATGRAKAAAGRGATRGVCQETGGGTDQFAATANGSGGRLGQIAGQRGKAGGSQRGLGERWRWAKATRGSAQSSAGAVVRGTWPAKAVAVRRTEEQRRAGLEEEDED